MTDKSIPKDLTADDYRHSGKTVEIFMDDAGCITLIQGYGEDDPCVVSTTFEQALQLMKALDTMLVSHMIFPAHTESTIH